MSTPESLLANANWLIVCIEARKACALEIEAHRLTRAKLAALIEACEVAWSQLPEGVDAYARHTLYSAIVNAKETPPC